MDEGTDSVDPRAAPGPVTDTAGCPSAGCRRTRRRRPVIRLPHRQRNAPSKRASAAGGEGRRAGNHGRSSRWERGPFYAALDLGTNNCRLLIAEPARRRLPRRRFVFAHRAPRRGRRAERPPRRGGDGPRHRRASRSARRSSRCGASRARASSRRRPAASRRTAREFLDRVRARDRPAARDRRPPHRGAARRRGMLLAARPRRARGAVLFDIGGGSSEIVWLDRRKRRSGAAACVRAWVSLPVGVVTLAERHGGIDVDERCLRGDGRRRALGVPPLPCARCAARGGGRPAPSTISAPREP